MKIASLTPFKPDSLKRQWGSFRQMRDIVDIVIVALDNCEVFAAASVFDGARVDEIIKLENNLGWEDYTTRLTLLARAAAHKCDWVLWLDDDETLVGRYSGDPLLREKLLAVINDSVERGCEIITFDKREMWTPTHYRTDGVWGEKNKVVLQKNPFALESVHWRGSHLEQLHYYPLQVADTVHREDCRLLHWGMSTPELRQARYKKYKSLHDPTNNRGYGYDYLVNEDGLTLEKL
jgi:hypothetical protein